MPTSSPTGYLLNVSDPASEPVALHPDTRYRLGRAPTNRIPLPDDLCSREHAELYAGKNGWVLRDLNSTNGSYLNESRVTADSPLAENDIMRFGRTKFAFTATLNKKAGSGSSPRIEIKSRIADPKYLPTETLPIDAKAPPPVRPGPAEALARLYKLGLDMAAATTPAELTDTVAVALLAATPADVAAVLAPAGEKDWEPVAYRTRGPIRETYHKVSQFVSAEVLSTKQAVLAENIARDRKLTGRDSINELKASSLICAPVLAEGNVIGLVHLYGVGGLRLAAEDLEITLAAARQLAAVWLRLKREAVLAADVQALKGRLPPTWAVVGESEPIRALGEQIRRVAETRATVLIRGESGVGKELVARAVHQSSKRKDGPFVCLNCAALPETLLESELFGHEKGAFTGATDRLIGKFEAADQGTIFLDEIGEMSPAIQAKFLRVLEGQSFERIGGNVPIRVDVRVVAATNRPLEDAVRDGTFRKDLFYRLQVVQLDVPPLRDRSADVPLIANHFLKHFGAETGRKLKGFTPAAVAKLREYAWPGNVRELRNVVERAVALCHGPEIDAGDIWLSPLDGPAVVEYEPVPLAEIEKRHIAATLRHTNWNKSKAADILGIERTTLDRKIKAFGLTKE